MGTKGGVVLDVPALCEVAAAAQGFMDFAHQSVIDIKAKTSTLHGDQIDGMSGGQGEAINEAIADIEKMADEIEKLAAEILQIVREKADITDALQRKTQAAEAAAGGVKKNKSAVTRN